jgi:hypothetical protein
MVREPSPIHRALAELLILGQIEVVPGSDPPRYRAVPSCEESTLPERATGALPPRRDEDERAEEETDA